MGRGDFWGRAGRERVAEKQSSSSAPKSRTYRHTYNYLCMQLINFKERSQNEGIEKLKSKPEKFSVLTKSLQNNEHFFKLVYKKRIQPLLLLIPSRQRRLRHK